MTEAANPEMADGGRRLPEPHGGELKDLVVDATRAEALQEEAVDLDSWSLTDRQLLDAELLLNGAFSPLDGFLTQSDYERVCHDMRLSDGTLWPMPITLDVSEEFAKDRQLADVDRLALRHPEGMVLGILSVEDVWKPDLEDEARTVFGTTSTRHPGVRHLLEDANPVYVGGRIAGIEYSQHHTFQPLRHTPAELRNEFHKRGWTRVVAFQTRNPLHRAHVELTKRAAARAEASLLIHPVVGRTRPGDVDSFSRVRCYEAVLPRFPPETTMLSLLPLAMRMGGPREALWHALIRKNFGCSHFVVGRDHAGPGKDGDGTPFYEAYAAQELVREHADEAGVQLVDFEELVYVEELADYVTRSEVPDGAKVLDLSGTELRRRLRAGLEIPAWFSYPEVIDELRKTYPPRHRQGFTVFFTGFSGAGKSTIAQILVAKLNERGGRPVTLLDGDIVRTHLSSELGFSKKHRDLNIQRIGFVASEITKNRGIAICAPIAPYKRTRKQVREMIEAYGGFVLVHVATPLEVCEARDRKGLYAKARAGIVKNFTGISDPYEEPEDAEVVLDTTKYTPEEAAQLVFLELEKQGYVQ